jgi:hypothetical protein
MIRKDSKVVGVLREALWWIITAVVAVILMEPITSKLDYNFYWFNLFGIILSIQAFRFGLLFREYKILFGNRWVRALFFIVNIHLIVLIIARTHVILALVENFRILDFGAMKTPMNLEEQYELMKYITAELELVAVAAVLMMVFMNLRILMSYFRQSKVRFRDLPTTEKSTS